MEPSVDPLLSRPGVFLPRAIFYLILLLLGASVLWASLAEVDVVIRARGRLGVEGEPLRITPPEQGLVTDVRVRAGDRVSKGDILLKLDPLRLASEAAATEEEIKALRAEAAHARDTASERRALLRSVGEERKALDRAAEILSARAKTWSDLLARGVVSAVQVEGQEREVLELQARRARLDTELARGESEAAQSERRAVESDARARGLESRRAALVESETRMTLRAPCAGVVTQVVVTHPGRVIGTGDPAVVINPEGLPLKAELRVPNGSIRRLRPGMKVKMRLDAFPYADFGVADGALERIDPDADAEGNYRAWATVDASELRGPRGRDALQAGLQLDADIVAERRTVLDYLLRPFRRIGDTIPVSE